jgi:hypothetical protein
LVTGLISTDINTSITATFGVACRCGKKCERKKYRESTHRAIVTSQRTTLMMQKKSVENFLALTTFADIAGASA